MNLNGPNRQKRLLIITCVALGVLVLEYWVRVPLTNLWRAQTTELTSLRKKVSDGRYAIERGPRNERDWAEMQANALAKDVTQAEQTVLTAFDGFARTANVEIAGQRPQWKRGTTDRYSLYEYRLDITGSLASLSRFLYEVERSPLALRVDSMDLTARDETGQRLTLGLIVSGLRLAPLERTRQP